MDKTMKRPVHARDALAYGRAHMDVVVQEILVTEGIRKFEEARFF